MAEQNQEGQNSQATPENPSAPPTGDKKKREAGFSIVYKLGMFILLFGTVVSILLAGFGLYKDYQEQLVEIEERFESIKESRLGSLADSIWNVDEEQIEIQLKAIEALPNIEYLKVTNEGDTYEKGEPDIKKRSKEKIEKTLDILYDGKEKIGTIYLYAGLDEIQAGLVQQFWSILQTQAMEKGATLLFIFMILHVLVIKHLKFASHYLKNIVIEDDSVLKLPRKEGRLRDELTSMTVAINGMKSKLKKSQEELKHYSENLEKMVEERTREVLEKQRDIEALFHSIPVSVVVVVEDGKLGAEYSPMTTEIFETDTIANENFEKFLLEKTTLSSDKKGQVLSIINACMGEDILNYDMNSDGLVNEVEIDINGKHKILDVTWSCVTNEEEVVEKILVCMRDVTELKALTIKALKQGEEIRKIGEIITLNDRQLKNFVVGTKKLIASCREIIEGPNLDDQESINLMLRNLHTIKGNCRTYRFKSITNEVHEIETIVLEVLGDKEKTFEPDKEGNVPGWNCEFLTKQMDKVEALYNEYHSTAEQLGKNVEAMSGEGGESASKGGSELALKMDNYRMVVKKLYEGKKKHNLNIPEIDSALEILTQIESEKLEAILKQTIESLGPLAQSLEKIEPQINIVDNGISFKRQYEMFLQDIFGHLLRNSMDHGLEKPEDRKAKSKEERGNINIDIQKDGTNIVITYGDDGKGLSIDGLKASALKKGIIQEGANPTVEEVASLIFESGFSTAKVVTDVSGRGVGMDAVRGYVKERGGDILIQVKGSKDENSFVAFEFKITLPDTCIFDFESLNAA